MNRKTVTIIIALGLAESTYLIGDIKPRRKGQEEEGEGSRAEEERGQDGYQG